MGSHFSSQQAPEHIALTNLLDAGIQKVDNLNEVDPVLLRDVLFMSIDQLDAKYSGKSLGLMNLANIQELEVSKNANLKL